MNCSDRLDANLLSICSWRLNPYIYSIWSFVKTVNQVLHQGHIQQRLAVFTKDQTLRMSGFLAN